MLRNTLTRLYMHQKWWINDPDCMLLRDPLAFTNEEVMGLASVKAMSGGSMIISDNFENISKSRMHILLKILPPSNKAAIAIDLLEHEVPELLRLHLTSNYFRLEGHKNAAASSASMTTPRKTTSKDDGWTRKVGRSTSSDAYVKDHVMLEVSSEEEESVHSFDIDKEHPLLEEEEEEEMHLLASDDELEAMHHSSLVNTQQDEEDLLDVTLDPVLMKTKSIDQVVVSPSMTPALAVMERAQPPSRQGSARKLTSAASFSQKSMQQLIQESSSTTASPLHGLVPSGKKKQHQHHQQQEHSQSSLALRLLGGMGSKVEQQFSEDSDSSPYFPYARKTLAMDDKAPREGELPSVDNASDGNSEEFSPLLSVYRKESHGLSMHPPLDSVKVFDVTKRSFSPEAIPKMDNLGEEVEESYGYGRRVSKEQPTVSPNQLIVGAEDLNVTRTPPSTKHKTAETTTAQADVTNSESFSRKAMLTSMGRSNSSNSNNHFRFQQYKQGVQVRQHFPSKDDLHKRWHLFTVGNWEVPDPHLAGRQQRSCIVDPITKAKSYFVSLRDIVGMECLHECQVYVQYLQQQSQVMTMMIKTPTRKSSLSAISQSFRNSPAHSLRGASAMVSNNNSSATHVANNNNPSYNNIEQLSHILHLFNFWLETYSHKVIQLHAEDGEEPGEVVFANVPFHSAHIYTLNISLHPMLPKFVGSNLHFSCGLEVKRCHMIETKEHVKISLTRKCFITMPKKRSKSNIFSPSAANALGTNIFATSISSASNGEHPYVPVVKTMSIEFEDFAIRNASWKGAIWIYLPVAFPQTKLYNHILGKTEVHGDVFYNPLNPGNGAINDGYGGISMVEYVEERSCRAAGYVYKLAIASPTPNQPSSTFQGNTKIEISWVADVEES